MCLAEIKRKQSTKAQINNVKKSRWYILLANGTTRRRYVMVLCKWIIWVHKISFHDKDGFRAQEFQMTRLLGQWISQLDIFTCRMWSFYLGHGVHDGPTVLRGEICYWIFSVGEDGVYTDKIASIRTPNGGDSTM